MKALRTLMLVLLVFNTETLLARGDDVTVALNLGRMHVTLPSQPRRIDTSDHGVVAQTYQCHGRDYAISATVAGIPRIATLLGVQTIYDQAAKVTLQKNRGSTQQSWRDIDMLGHPGAELTFHCGTGEHGLARYLFLDGRLYTLQASWYPSSPPQDVAHFFNSPTLLN